ncbi:hypothetical protein O9K63_14920 [Janibacter cremeus]|uniref:hypothetical protein n=1 Tax=Janibacter cremeus TaxID=1285192 RepID=UPI0023F94060|nr:hypothetical protein [Janibacter cremeus]WEV77866.1 hypothetical protein O9K63_14920 [Janibacter cremeus]
MDIPPLLLEDLEVPALRLERLADGVDGLVARTAHGTSHSWRGPAADRHRELVAAHAADLTALGAALRDAAAAVRTLAAVASGHAAVRRTPPVSHAGSPAGES